MASSAPAVLLQERGRSAADVLEAVVAQVDTAVPSADHHKDILQRHPESLGLKAVALPLLGLGELEEFRQLGARAILTAMLLHETVPPRHHLRCPRFERHAHHETCRRRCCAWPQRSSALLRASATPRVEIKERAAMSRMSSPTQFTWLWLDTLAAKAWKVDLRS